MHIQHCHSTVDNIHAVQCQNICDGSTAAQIYLTELCSLEVHLCLVEDMTQMCQILRIGIVGTGLASGSGEFVDDHTAA